MGIYSWSLSNMLENYVFSSQWDFGAGVMWHRVFINVIAFLPPCFHFQIYYFELWLLTFLVSSTFSISQDGVILYASSSAISGLMTFFQIANSLGPEVVAEMAANDKGLKILWHSLAPLLSGPLFLWRTEWE